MNKITKKIFFTLLITFILFGNIDAFEKQYLYSCPLNRIKKISSKSTSWGKGTTSNLYTNLSFDKKVSIKISDGLLQGFALTDKYLFFARWYDDYSTSDIYILNNNTFEQETVISKYNFGHANDLTYNPNTKKLVISNSSNNSINRLSLFNIKDKLIFDDKFGINILNGKIKSFNNTDNPFILNQSDNNISMDPSAIAYDRDHNQYIIFSYFDKKIHIMDDKFEDIRNFSIINKSIDLDPTVMTSQGLSYWNNHIYYTVFESGRPSVYQNIYNYDETSSNLIYVFDLYGNLDRILYIPTSKLGFNTDSNYIKTAAEIESIDFYDDGTMLLGFNIFKDYYTYKNSQNCNGWNSENEIAFYTSDSLKRDSLNIKEIKLKNLPKKLEYTKDDQKLDLTDGILQIEYMDGITEELNLTDKNISVTGYDNTKIGINSIKVDYGNNTTTFDISIIPSSN